MDVRHVTEREELLRVIEEHGVFGGHGEHQAVGQGHQRPLGGPICGGTGGQRAVTQAMAKFPQDTKNNFSPKALSQGTYTM